MFYRGELANFYPPYFLAFLASFNQDGILVIHDSEPLTISIMDGAVIDAHSSRADTTLLRTLLHKGTINRSQLQQVINAKKETHLSCRQVLRSLNFSPWPPSRLTLSWPRKRWFFNSSYAALENLNLPTPWPMKIT